MKSITSQPTQPKYNFKLYQQLENLLLKFDVGKIQLTPAQIESSERYTDTFYSEHYNL